MRRLNIFGLTALVGCLLPTFAQAVFFPPEPLSSSNDYDQIYFTDLNITGACLAIVVGTVFCFFGYRLFRLVAFSTGAIIGGCTVFFFLQSGGWLWWWVNLIFAIPVAIATGVFVLCYAFAAFFSIGFLFGFIVVAVVWSGFFGQAFGTNETGDVNEWFIIVEWVFLILGGIAVGLTNLIFQRNLSIISTSAIGAYFITVGIDFFIQDDFAVVVRDLFFGQVAHFTPLWGSFVICVLWILIAVGGAASQFLVTALGVTHRFRHIGDNEDDDDAKINGGDLVIASYA